MKKISFLLAILIIAFSAMAQEMEVNTSKSELKWTGKKVSGEHWGYINLKDGSLTIKNDKIISGTFNIVMNSIVCEDLEDAEWNGKLIGHLKSDDFFSVEKFPTATLKITESKSLMNNEYDVMESLIKSIDEVIDIELVISDLLT